MKSRTALSALSAFALLGVMSGALASENVDELRRCAQESDNATRLACYDRMAKQGADRAATTAAQAPTQPREKNQTSPQASPPPLPQSSAATTQPRNESSMDDFGLPGYSPRKSSAGDPPQLTSTITKLDKQLYGNLVFTLENAQVWEQREPDSRLQLHTGDVVTIKAGVLGSYSLVTPSKRTTLVRRMR